jgi:hypothetical protein
MKENTDCHEAAKKHMRQGGGRCVNLVLLCFFCISGCVSADKLGSLIAPIEKDQAIVLMWVNQDNVIPSFISGNDNSGLFSEDLIPNVNYEEKNIISGFKLYKLKADKTYSIAGASVGEGFWSNSYFVCGKSKTFTFMTKSGRITYIGHFNFKQKGGRLEAIRYHNFDDAISFIRKEYPSLSENMYSAELSTTRAIRSCTQMIYVALPDGRAIRSNYELKKMEITN